MKKNLAKEIALRAMLIAAAFVLSWVEAQIPYPFPLPGIKLGFTNLVVLIALYRLSYWDALAINIVRIILVGFTFGNMYSLFYSLAGGILSFSVMFVFKKYIKADLKFVSIAGALAHNLGQILLAMGILNSTKIAWYLPFLWIAGIVAGIVIGILGEILVKRLPANLFLVLLLVAVSSLSACGLPDDSNSQFFAMDTFMTLEAYGNESAEAVKLAEEKIEELDNLWSVGLHNSEISLINQGQTQSLSFDTEKLLEKIQDIQKDTGGCLDLTVYPLMELWGFTSQDMKKPSDQAIKECMEKISPDNLILDRSSSTLTLLNGAQIDLGAVAKGYATDKVVEIFKEKGITSAHINLGGNVYVLGHKRDGSNWRIAVENPNKELEKLKGADYLGVLSLHDMAVVTSGDYHRFFIEDGIKYHHIMDPETGYPAKSGLISVTIVSSDATLADALSTALFVMGKEKALAYWQTHSDLFELILVEEDGSITISPGLKKIFSSDLGYSVFE